MFDTGAGKKGAAAGPIDLKNKLISGGVEFDLETTAISENTENNTEHLFCKNIETIKANADGLATAVENAINKGEFPLIFSGDHSNAIGGMSGLKNAYPEKNIGVIWIDAHADLHSPYTTPSGNMHGMPLAALLGMDNTVRTRNEVTEAEQSLWNELKAVGSKKIVPKILPDNLAFIALRDAEPEEWGLIDDYGITYFGPDDIKDHGIYYAINHALKKLEHCDGLYISFDVDSMDPSISVGTGTPVPEGLSIVEAESVVKTLLKHPKTLAFEVTEINPSLDEGGSKMADVTASILQFAFKS